MLEEIKASAFIAKWGAGLLFALAVFTIVIGGFLWNRHVSNKNAAAVPQATAIQNKAQANAGGDATNTVAANAKKNEATDEKTAHVTNIFNTYPQAKVGIDPAFFDAFNRGICMYNSASGLPECKRLLEPDTRRVENP